LYRIFLCAIIFGLGLSHGQTNPVEAERNEAIFQTKLAIREEMVKHGGDWNKWYDSLAPFRKELADKASAAKPGEGIFQPDGKPPFYFAIYMAHYLVSPQPAEEFARTRPSVPVIIAFNKFLKAHNIDLIFVPAPKVIEVYPERIEKNVPADRLVAPQMRKLILDLLEADVEVLDVLPSFLEEAQKPGEPLYLQADSHWADRGQRIAARLIANSLKRYGFVKDALAQKPVYDAKQIALQFKGNMFADLKPAQQAELADAINIHATLVSTADGKPFAETENAPIVVIGDSYTHYYEVAVKQGTGLTALLAKEVNLPNWNITTGGATTQPLKEFLRDPDLLKSTKVVVWMITNDQFAVPAPDQWQMLPFPPAPNVADGAHPKQ
jgi:hypothetical protein